MAKNGFGAIRALSLVAMAIGGGVVLVGCGGGGTAALPHANGGVPSTTSNVEVHIVIPGNLPAAGYRHVAYVSPGTQSITVSSQPQGGTPYPSVTVNLGSSACPSVPSSGGYSCTVTVTAAIGIPDTFTVTAYAQQNGGGAALATGSTTVTFTVVNGQLSPSSVNLTLGGVIASLKLSVNGVTTSPVDLPVGAATATLQVQAVDASGNAIVGTCASPVPAITLSENSTSGGPPAGNVLSLSKTSLACPRDTVTLGFAGAPAYAGAYGATPIVLTASASGILPGTVTIDPQSSVVAYQLAAPASALATFSFDGMAYSAVSNTIYALVDSAPPGTLYAFNVTTGSVATYQLASTYPALSGSQTVTVDGQGDVWYAVQSSSMPPVWELACIPAVALGNAASQTTIVMLPSLSGASSAHLGVLASDGKSTLWAVDDANDAIYQLGLGTSACSVNGSPTMVSFASALTGGSTPAFLNAAAYDPVGSRFWFTDGVHVGYMGLPLTQSSSFVPVSVTVPNGGSLLGLTPFGGGNMLALATSTSVGVPDYPYALGLIGTSGVVVSFGSAPQYNRTGTHFEASVYPRWPLGSYDAASAAFGGIAGLASGSQLGTTGVSSQIAEYQPVVSTTSGGLALGTGVVMPPATQMAVLCPGQAAFRTVFDASGTPWEFVQAWTLSTTACSPFEAVIYLTHPVFTTTWTITAAPYAISATASDAASVFGDVAFDPTTWKVTCTTGWTCAFDSGAPGFISIACPAASSPITGTITVTDPAGISRSVTINLPSCPLAG